MKLEPCMHLCVASCSEAAGRAESVLVGWALLATIAFLSSIHKSRIMPVDSDPYSLGLRGPYKPLQATSARSVRMSTSGAGMHRIPRREVDFEYHVHQSR